MKFYSNKFLISFLILTVLFYGVFIKTAEAGWFSDLWEVADDFFDAVHRAAEVVVELVTSITNILINTVVATVEMTVGAITGNSYISEDGSCRWENLHKNAFRIYAGRCDNSSWGNSGGGR